MSDVRLVFRPGGIRSLGSSEETAAELGKAAEKIEKRVHPNRGSDWAPLTVRSRWGVGPKGAYAQVIMAGIGAIAWEFGTRHMAARAPLRKALRGAR